MLYTLLLLLSAIPIGFLIAWLTRDELVAGRRWIGILSGISILIGILGIIYALPVWIYTSAFILIVCCISLWKSHDKQWTKRKL